MKLKLLVCLIFLFFVILADFENVIARKRGRKHRGRNRGKKRHSKRHGRLEEGFNSDLKGELNRGRILDEEPTKSLVHPVVKKQTSFDIEEYRVATVRADPRSNKHAPHIATATLSHHSKRHEHLRGKLVYILDDNKKTHYGCSGKISNTNKIPSNRPWVALVERGKCYFFIKIRLAHLHNASAIIIYNNKENTLVMHSAGTNIVSVMVKKSDGKHLAKLAEVEGGVDVTITVSNKTRKTLDGTDTLNTTPPTSHHSRLIPKPSISDSDSSLSDPSRSISDPLISDMDLSSFITPPTPSQPSSAYTLHTQLKLNGFLILSICLTICLFINNR